MLPNLRAAGGKSLAARRTGAEFQAIHAVIADHAAPQRIVQIQDQQFFHLAGDLAQGGAEARDIGRQAVLRERQFGAVPGAGILPQAVGVEKDNILAGLQQRRAEIGDLRGGAGGEPEFGDAGEALGRQCRQMLDDATAGRGTQQAVPGMAPGIDLCRDRGGGFGLWRVERQVGDRIAPRVHQQNQVRREAVQSGVRVQRFLPPGAESGLINQRLKAFLSRADRGGAGDEIGRATAGDRQPQIAPCCRQQPRAVDKNIRRLERLPAAKRAARGAGGRNAAVGCQRVRPSISL